jgi:hypothetical protein
MSATPRPALRLPRTFLFIASLCLLVSPNGFAKGIQAPAKYNAGQQPGGVVIADFNGDGRPDVLVFDAFANFPETIHVLLTNADGTLSPSISTSGGGSTFGGAAAGDFNKDGKMDVAVVDSNANTLTIFLGNGDGTFTKGASYPTGHRPMAIIALDSNVDGNLDLVVANNNDNSVSSFLGIGDGTFTLKGTFGTGFVSPSSLAAGNLDSDGKLDLVVGSLNIGAFGVLPGLGNGNFASVRLGTYAADFPSGGVAIADLDGDGKMDLVFSGQPASYYRGNGNLTFQSPVTLDVNGYSSLAIADLNGDGHNDIVLTGSLRTGSSVILSNGHGGFLAAKRYAQLPFADFYASLVAVADLHGDHKLDVITVSNVGGVVQVIRGNGDGTLQGAFAYDSQVSDIAISQAVGDFNGDGKADMATLDGTGKLSVLLNTGNYSFSLIPSVDYGFESGPITAADVNNDGKMDILIAGQSHISVLVNKGDGTFQTPVIIDIPSASFPAHGLIVADLNGDGKPDIAFSSSTPELTPGAGSVTFGILFGNGDGTFQTLQAQDNYSLTGKIVGLLPAADLNGDHKLDIVAVGLSSVAIYLNNGNGVFTTGNVYTLDDFAFDAPAGAIGDLRGSGVNDIVIGKGNSTTPKVNILKGNGDGTFVNSTVPLTRGAAGLALGDFDGDGKLDVAVQEFGFELEIFPGLGTGALGTPILRQSPASRVVAVDMAGGGFPDLVTIDTYPVIIPNAGGSHISFVSNINPTMYGQTVTLAATVQPTVPGVLSSGNVTISDGSSLLASPPVSSGTASLSTTFAVGTHTIHAQFSGDDNLFARTLPTITLPVNKATTTSNLTLSSFLVFGSRSASFAAAVTSATGGVPSGSISLMDGSSLISTSALDGGGHATFSMTLAPGAHDIRLSYAGDANYAASTSTASATRVLDLALSAGRTSRSARSHAISAQPKFQIQVAAVGGEVSPVHLECVGLPAGSACVFSEQDFVLNGSRVIEGSIVTSTSRSRRVSGRATATIPQAVQIRSTAGEIQKTLTVPLQ